MRGKYNINSQCNYGDAYIFVKGIIAITGDREDDAEKWLDERNKRLIFKSLCAIFCLHK